MTFELRSLDDKRRWELDDKEMYDYILSCKRRVSDWLHVEEVFGYVVECWCDLETHIHNRTLRSHDCAVNSVMRRARFFDDRALADRLMLCFLSATRMYLDHLKKPVKAILGQGSDDGNDIDGLRNRFRAQDPFFLIADELRNRMQHDEFGVAQISYCQSMLNAPASRGNVGLSLSLPLHDLSPIISYLRGRRDSTLEKDHCESAFTLRLKREIKTCEEVALPVELRDVMRRFCSGLAIMHEELRGRVGKHLEDAIQGCESSYYGEHHDSAGESGVFLISYGKNGERLSQEWIGSALVERLRYLRDKYSGWDRLGTLIHGALPAKR